MELAIVENDEALATRDEVDRNSRLKRGNTAPDAICKTVGGGVVVRGDGGFEKSKGGQKE